MRKDWDWSLEDPYILDVASQFLEGYEREKNQQDRLLESLEDDKVREALFAGNPALAAYYEGKTKEQLEERKPLMAIAVGVAFAIRRASAITQ